MLRQDAEREKCQRERERGIEKERENNKKRHGGAIEVPNLSLFGTLILLSRLFQFNIFPIIFKSKRQT